jgi:hypothetical protein
MDANERRLSIAQCAMLNRDCLFAFVAAFDAKDLKSAESCGQRSFRHHARSSGLFFASHWNQRL